LILCCDTSVNVHNVLSAYKTEIYRYDGYDGYDISEETRKLRYDSESLLVIMRDVSDLSGYC